MWVQQMLQAACLSNSIIVGFRISFNPAFGAWGLYQPVSTEKEQPISRLLLWVAICFCCVLLNKWEWFILTLFYMLTLNLQILLQ